MTTISASSSSALSGRSDGTPPGLYEHGGLLRVRMLDRFPELLHSITTRRAPDGADWNLSARRGTPEHRFRPEARQVLGHERTRDRAHRAADAEDREQALPLLRRVNVVGEAPDLGDGGVVEHADP